MWVLFVYSMEGRGSFYMSAPKGPVNLWWYVNCGWNKCRPFWGSLVVVEFNKLLSGFLMWPWEHCHQCCCCPAEGGVQLMISCTQTGLDFCCMDPVTHGRSITPHRRWVHPSKETKSLLFLSSCVFCVFSGLLLLWSVQWILGWIPIGGLCVTEPCDRQRRTAGEIHLATFIWTYYQRGGTLL